MFGLRLRGRLGVGAVVGSASLVGLFYFGCDAGGGSQFEDDAGNTEGSSNGGSAGLDFAQGGSGGGISNCTDPTCVGNTPQGNCDSGLGIASANAMDGVKAMGLCKEYVDGEWGVMSAEWVRSDGQPLTGVLARGKGILSHFGNAITPHEGQNMLVLSSGSARNPGEPDFNDPGGDWKDMTAHGAPPGYPKESPSCPAGTMTGLPYDSAGLRLVLKTPTDAQSFAFEFVFFTYEYPDYICDLFNDFFVAMMTPTPSGLPDGNISFDDMGNTISVNAGFLTACNPCTTGGKVFDCPLGYSEILGTGFDSNTFVFNCPIQGSAGTSWLTTTAPIENPGEEITLHFAIWDSEDGILDSTTVIDNFKFDPDETGVGTIPTPE